MRYFEDFHVGDTFELGQVTVTEEEIIAFARQFDPQPFHIDRERAKSSYFGELVASGWHTTALFMRLFVDGLLNESASLASPGVDNVRWPKPVHAGDTLSARFTVSESTPSRSRSTLGIIRSHCEMLNQKNELVFTLEGIHFLGRRPAELNKTEER
jgi:acyl dehydratase